MRRVWLVTLAVGLSFAILAVFLLMPRGYGDQKERSESLQLARAASSRVREGMTLAEAERALGDAWYHIVCEYKGGPYGDFSEHLYLYGSRDPNLSGVVYLRTKVADGGERIAMVGSVENYQLWEYDDCTDLDLSTTKGK